jgi:sodium transport system permease protein
MNWSRVRLIFEREVRDQVRDRRTMFTIFVLPLLLYPFMGMLMLQVAQFHAEHAVRITWIGEDNWPSDRPLLSQNKSDNDESLLHWTRLSWKDLPSSVNNWEDFAVEQLKANATDLVLISKPGMAEALQSESPSTPLITVINQASDQSVIAAQRLSRLLEDWQGRWLHTKLIESQLDPSILQPLRPQVVDVAPRETKQALVWSKLLPLVMLVWALTGAFYPAIDLCAGEKERGTLETLLSSPATRREIVWGKLLTVMTFSIATAVLNLLSMQLTSSFVIDQFARLGGPNAVPTVGPLPLTALTWLLVILLPISTMFSALALAVAALARSSKEGQYYLMPLLLGGLPLVLLPMVPGMGLTVGSSAIPVTGAVLLARALIEGQYADAILHAPIVIVVTIVCCLLAVRWAVRQFESEAVMFRESERFEWALWLKHLWRDRAATATANEALLCGVIILVALFFGRLSLSNQDLSWTSIARTTLAIQLGMILGPTLIMAGFMTASVRRALRLEIPRPIDFLFAAILGVSLHPIYLVFATAIQQEFQLGVDTKQMLVQIDQVIAAAPLWSVLLIFAVLPALCEELAFRGFIFGGLSRDNGTLRAILVSSLFFGFSHGVLQQSMTATTMGLVLGIVAWKSGGVVCGIVIHVLHNGLTMVLSRLGKTPEEIPSTLDWAFQITPQGQLAYSWTWLALSLGLSALSLAWFIFRQTNLGHLRDFTLQPAHQPSSPTL